MKNAPVTDWDMLAAMLLVSRIEQDTHGTENRVTQAAQFLADLQAAAAHKAWDQGHYHGTQFGLNGTPSTNPYPKLDP